MKKSILLFIILGIFFFLYSFMTNDTRLKSILYICTLMCGILSILECSNDKKSRSYYGNYYNGLPVNETANLFY